MSETHRNKQGINKEGQKHAQDRPMNPKAEMNKAKDCDTAPNKPHPKMM
jgi:hypothetical protein